MSNEVTVGTVMHELPHTVGTAQTIAVAQDMLESYRIRHLPVCEGGRLCGILSERDIEFALRVDGAKPDNVLVKDCFTPEPYAVTSSTPLAEVVRRMADDRLGCAVIVERERVVGIFTTVDACRVLSEMLSLPEE